MQNDLFNKIYFAISDFEYLNNRLTMDWLKYFNKYSTKK